MDNDKEYMQIALNEAQKAFDKNEIPVGCIIVKNHKVIGKGYNLKERLNLAMAHAEMIAIKEASKTLGNWRLEGCTLYVTLEPCAMCASAIVQSRVSRVVIGALDNKEGSVVSSKHIFENNHNHELLVSTKVLENECHKLLVDFLKNKR